MAEPKRIFWPFHQARLWLSGKIGLTPEARISRLFPATHHQRLEGRQSVGNEGFQNLSNWIWRVGQADHGIRQSGWRSSRQSASPENHSQKPPAEMTYPIYRTRPKPL